MTRCDLARDSAILSLMLIASELSRVYAVTYYDANNLSTSHRDI